jgi:transformation/transcription domain-associated protein
MELAIARALCAIWKESAADEIAITAERSYVALAHVLRRCHASEAQGGLARDGDLADLEKSSFKEVMSFLGLELCAPNLTVRSNAQKIIGEVSEFLAQPASSILEPFKASMSQQIFKRRLTNFPVAVQIAHIDALTFCLSLQPPFMFQDPGGSQTTEFFSVSIRTLYVAANQV